MDEYTHVGFNQSSGLYMPSSVTALATTLVCRHPDSPKILQAPTWTQLVLHLRPSQLLVVLPPPPSSPGFPNSDAYLDRLHLRLSQLLVDVACILLDHLTPLKDACRGGGVHTSVTGRAHTPRPLPRMPAGGVGEDRGGGLASSLTTCPGGGELAHKGQEQERSP